MIIPIPTYTEPEEIHVPDTPSEKGDWIRWFLDCPHWKCDSCRITNFGRNKYCANTKCKQPRPTSYVENVFPT